MSVELNLNDDTIEWLYDVDQFEANDIDFIVGDAASRHLKFDLPKVIFQVPEVVVPENGSIPFTSEGTAFQTALDAADEVTAGYI